MGRAPNLVQGRVKQRVFEVLKIPSAQGDRLGAAFDTFIVTLIALNAFAVIFETVGDNHERYGALLRAFELLSLAVFGAEYVLRVWSITADPQYAHPVWGRLRFMASPLAIVDVLAILPSLLLALDLRVIRVLRMLRLLKLGRYSESLRVLGNVLHRRGEELLMSLFVVGLGLTLTASFMYYAEHEAQPEAFSSIPAAMWWAIVALSTTGYGDIVPVTTVGKILGGLTALLGIASIALPVGILSSGFVEEVNSRRGGNKTACPHCGKDTRKGPE